MKIALVTTFPPSKGSLNEYAFHFVNHLKTKPEVSEITILGDIIDEAETYHEANVKIDRIWKFGAMDNTLRIRNAVQKHQPDVVLFNLQFATFADSRMSAALGLTAPALAKSPKTLSTILLHNIMETVDLGKAGFGGNPIIENMTRLFGNIFTRMLLRSDLVAVTIPKYVDILTEKYQADHVILAPHGAFEEVPEPDFVLPDGARQIMTFGKFGTYKKVEALIEAFELLQNELDMELELVIAGTSSPNTPGYIESVQEKYSHVNNVRYTGYVLEEDVPKIFGDSTVVVFPYNSTTGSSGVLHQAGTYGKAVVLPNLGDFAELITEEGYVGKFFEPDNARSLADAIKHYLVDMNHIIQDGKQNYVATSGLPMSDVVDWYLLHFERLLAER